MPLWLDLLRTPMAAPETASLRRLRLTWQGLCLSLAANVALLQPLEDVFGRAPVCLAAALMLATLCITILYLACKHRADCAFLDSPREDA